MSFVWMLSQVLTVLAYAFLGIGLVRKSKLDIMLFNCIFQALMGVHFLLLGGTLGLIASAVNLLRNVVFAVNERRGRANPKWLLAGFALAVLALTAFFFRVPTDLFPGIFALIGLFIYWYPGTRVVRIGTFAISVCYIAYAVPLASWSIVACEIFVMISTTVGYLRYERKPPVKYP